MIARLIGALRATSRRRLLAAAGAVALVLLAAAGFGWSRLGGDGAGAGTSWSAGSAGPDPVSTAGSGGATGSDPAPSASAGPATDPGSGAGAPPPRIHPFANELSGTTRTGAPSPTAPLEMAEGLDGCDHGYGGRDVCVPWSLPPGVTDGCAWLRERDYPPLPVRNPRDRHGLDRDGDGVACGPGD